MKRLSILLLVALAAAVVVLEGQTVRPQLLGIGQAPPPSASSNAAFFDDTVLQEVRLDMNSRDWQTLKDNFRLDDYFPADFRWLDQVVRSVGIRSRGGGSRSGRKPGLRVDFDRNTAGQTFLGLKSLVLRNNTQDASNMRERISMQLFNRLGLLAPREAYTKLFVNGDYVGLYTIVESIDKDFLKRTLNENDGYLFSYEYVTPYYFEDLGSDPATYVPFPFDHQTHKSDPRPELIVQLVQAINQTGEAAFRSVIAEYVDLRKFIRHVAVERFLADYDSIIGDFGMNNFYMYQFQNKKLFTFIAWDKSQAMSRVTDSIWRNITEGPAHSNNLLTRALVSRDLYDLYLDALLECVASLDDAGATDGRRWIDREIDREYAQIRDAVYADPQKDYTNDQFEGEVSKIKEFTAQRGDIVKQAVTAGRSQGPPR